MNTTRFKPVAVKPTPKESAAALVRRKLALASQLVGDQRVVKLARSWSEQELDRKPAMTAAEANRMLHDNLRSAAEIVAAWRQEERMSSFAG